MKKVYCSNCGMQMNADDRFCPNCGAPNIWRPKRKRRIIIPVLCAAAAVFAAVSLYQFVYLPKQARSQYMEFWLYGASKYGSGNFSINHNTNYRITKTDEDWDTYDQTTTYDYGDGTVDVHAEFDMNGYNSEDYDYSYTYDRYGNPEEIRDVKTDRYHRVTHCESENGEASYDYAYYKNGELASRDMETEDLETHAEYDEQGTMISERMIFEEDGCTQKVTADPTYDEAGRLTKLEVVTRSHFEDGDYPDDKEDTTYEFEYDDHGNCVKVTDDQGGTAEISYEKIP